jgi:hypothetical protein
VRRFIDYLAGYVAGFDRDYFYPSEVEAYTTPTPTDQDGGVLLSIHELRSYESLDFDAMEDQQKVWSNTDEGDVYEDLPTNSWEQGEPEVAHEVLSYSEQSSSFGPHDAPKQGNVKKKEEEKDPEGATNRRSCYLCVAANSELVAPNNMSLQQFCKIFNSPDQQIINLHY